MMGGGFDPGSRNSGGPIVFKSGAPVSIICPAATFAGVTCASNGGKVQLVSAGVHGLTSGVAVGTSVWVSWAGGTGINGLYNVLSVDDTLKFTVDLPYTAGLGTPTVAVTNTEITVATIKLPALSIFSHIEVSAFATNTGSSTKAMFIKLGSSDWLLRATGVSSNAMRIFGSIFNAGSTFIQNSTGDATPQAATVAPLKTSNIDTSTTSDLKISVTASTNEKCVLNNYLIKVFI